MLPTKPQRTLSSGSHHHGGTSNANNPELPLTIGQNTPFPYLPMVAIMLSLICQQVVQMSVFAYAGYMVQFLGVVSDKDKAGYYAGVLSSAFVTGRMFSAHFWGVVSDRCSPWYVILFGLLSTVVLSGVFGLSTTFAGAFVSRFMLGLLNGITVASKPLVSEVCGKEHETVGMGVLTTAWSIGAVLGPGIGGLLAEPAIQHPQIFSELGIFGRYPYLLPNLVAVGLVLLALPLVLYFAKDVHLDGSAFTIFQDHLDDDVSGNRKDDRGEASHGSAASKSLTTFPTQYGGTGKALSMNVEVTRLNAGGNASAKDVDNVGGNGKDVNRESLLSQPQIRALLFIDGVYSFAFSGFDEVFPLWCLSTVAKGGLDWSSLQIGQVFFVCGLSVFCFDMILVPHITPRLGIKTTQRLGSVLLVPLYIVIPMLSTANAAGYPVGAVSLVLLFTGYVCSHMVFVGLSLAVNNATTPDRRGELNGISMVMSSLARSISPIVCSMLFAFSINRDHSYPFDYHLVFYLLAAARLGMACLAWNRIGNI